MATCTALIIHRAYAENSAELAPQDCRAASSVAHVLSKLQWCGLSPVENGIGLIRGLIARAIDTGRAANLLEMYFNQKLVFLLAS